MELDQQEPGVHHDKVLGPLDTALLLHLRASLDSTTLQSIRRVSQSACTALDSARKILKVT